MWLLEDKSVMRLILHKYPYLSHRRGGEEILRPTPLQREKHENEDITVSFLEESSVNRVIVFFTIRFYGLLLLEVSTARAARDTSSTFITLCKYFQFTQQYLTTLTIIQTENMTSWATTCFGDQLLTKSGLQSTTEVLKGKKYVGLYFR